MIKSWAQLSTQELYDILQLRLAVFSVEQDCPYQDCDGFDQAAIHLLDYKNENGNSELVAYLRIFESINNDHYQGRASIGRVCNDRSVRGQGLGKKIMQQAINYCDENFAKDIQISAQQYLEAFYQELDFKTISEPYLEDGIEHIAMIRKYQG